MKALLKVRNAAAFSLAFVVTLVAGTAFAGGTYDTITGAVDWSEVVTGIVAIAALVAAVLVVMRGSKMLLRMIGR
ncbi:MAG: hypothetical protein AAGF72_13075 [Pseudomonadota bacterium]